MSASGNPLKVDTSEPTVVEPEKIAIAVLHKPTERDQVKTRCTPAIVYEGEDLSSEGALATIKALDFFFDSVANNQMIKSWLSEGRPFEILAAFEFNLGFSGTNVTTAEFIIEQINQNKSQPLKVVKNENELNDLRKYNSDNKTNIIPVKMYFSGGGGTDVKDDRDITVTRPDAKEKIIIPVKKVKGLNAVCEAHGFQNTVKTILSNFIRFLAAFRLKTPSSKSKRSSITSPFSACSGSMISPSPSPSPSSSSLEAEPSTSKLTTLSLRRATSIPEGNEDPTLIDRRKNSP